MKTYRGNFDDTCFVQAQKGPDGRYCVVYADGWSGTLSAGYFEDAYREVPETPTQSTAPISSADLLAGMASPVAHPFITDETDARRVVLNMSQGDFMAVVKYLLVAELREDEDHGDLEEVTDRIFGQLDETAEMLEPNYAMGLA